MVTDRFVTTTRFSELCGVSVSAISKAKSTGLIFQGEDRLFDLTHPKNLTYLHKNTGKRDQSKRPVSESDAAVMQNRKVMAEIERRKPESERRPPPEPARKQPYNPMNDGVGGDALNRPNSVRRRREKTVDAPFDGVDWDGIDLSTLDKVDVDKLKVIEAIDSARLKNDQLRRTLIDRELVRVVLGKIHTVDVQEFLAIPIRFAPIAAGMCGKSDEQTIQQIEHGLQSELYKCLGHVQRIVEDFLTSLEDEINEPEA